MTDLKSTESTDIQFSQPLTIREATARAIVNISESPLRLAIACSTIPATTAVALGFAYPDTALRFFDAAKWAFLQAVMGK